MIVLNLSIFFFFKLNTLFDTLKESWFQSVLCMFSLKIRIF